MMIQAGVSLRRSAPAAGRSVEVSWRATSRSDIRAHAALPSNHGAHDPRKQVKVEALPMTPEVQRAHQQATAPPLPGVLQGPQPHREYTLVDVICTFIAAVLCVKSSSGVPSYCLLRRHVSGAISRRAVPSPAQQRRSKEPQGPADHFQCEINGM